MRYFLLPILAVNLISCHKGSSEQPLPKLSNDEKQVLLNTLTAYSRPNKIAEDVKTRKLVEDNDETLNQMKQKTGSCSYKEDHKSTNEIRGNISGNACPFRYTYNATTQISAQSATATINSNYEAIDLDFKKLNDVTSLSSSITVSFSGDKNQGNSNTTGSGNLVSQTHGNIGLSIQSTANTRGQKDFYMNSSIRFTFPKFVAEIRIVGQTVNGKTTSELTVNGERIGGSKSESISSGIAGLIESADSNLLNNLVAH